MRVEFPKEIKQIEKELTRVGKLIKLKAVINVKNIGLDLAVVQAKINEIKTTVAEAKAAYAAGEIEEAMDGLQTIRDDTHPGDINCVLNSFRDINTNFAKIKDAEIKAVVQAILDPAIEAIKEGDYRLSCQTFNEIRNELFRVIQTASKYKKVVDPKIKQNLQKLQELIDQKLGKEEPEAIPTIEAVPAE